MRFALLAAKPGHWMAFAAAEIVVALFALGRGTASLWLPGNAVPTPTMRILRVAAVLCAVLPLHRWPPAFARHLHRERALQVVRPLAALALAVVGIVPAVIVGIADRNDIAFTALLFALALLAVVAIGDYSWLAVSAVGMGAMMLDSAPTMPVTAAVAWVPAWAIALVCVGAGIVYARWGPRGSDDE